MMRGRRLISLFAIALLLSCENEMQVRSYPKVTTNSVFDISAKGAVFSGAVTGDVSRVEEHGFAWAQHDIPSIQKDDFVKLGTLSTNDFQKEITYSLQSGIGYYVRAFVTAGGTTVYGLPEKFVGMGSLGPVLVKMSKSEGQYLDTLELVVRNITSNQNKNKVLFNDITEGKILSFKDSILRITVPFLNSENNEVKVRVDNRATSTLPFKYFLPVIESVTPVELLYCDTLTVTGKYFPRDSMLVKLSIGSTEVKFKRAGVNILKHVAKVIYPTPNTVGVTFNSYKITAKNNFIQPESKIISPALNVKPGDTIVISGTNLPTCDVRVVSPSHNVQSLTILESTRTSIKVVLPNDKNTCARPDFLIVYPTVTGQQFLSWDGIKINTDNVYSGLIGEPLTIKGAGFGENESNISVRIGDSYARLLTLKDDQLTVIVPSPSFFKTGAELDIVVYQCSQTLTFTKGFQLLPAIITDFSPKDVTDVQTGITVTGRGFDANGWSFVGDTPITQLLNPAQSTTQIFVPLSSFITNHGSLQGQLPLKVTTGGKNGVVTTAAPLINFNIVTPWTHKKPFTGLYGGTPATSTGTHGYMCLNDTPSSGFGALFQYDPSTDIWTEKEKFPGGYRSFASLVGTNDRVYAGFGEANAGLEKDWWMYDPGTNTWTKKADLPGTGRRSAITVHLSGTVYAGGGGNFSSALHDFNAYDEATDTWIPKAPIPSSANSQPYAYFPFHGRIYLYALTGPNQGREYVYDATTDQWSERVIPISMFNSIAVSNIVFDDFVLFSSLLGNVKFVPGTNNTEVLPYPTGNFRSFTGFLLNDIAYLGFTGDQQPLIDLWSYDPSK